MKKLPVAVRNQAIAIANAMLRKSKKMKEGILIATSIKEAKKLATKATRKKASTKKTKVTAKKKTPAKSKAKRTTVKKVARPAKRKISSRSKKVTTASKRKVTGKVGAKVTARRPGRKATAVQAVRPKRKRIVRSVKKGIKVPVATSSATEVTHQERGLKPVPGKGGMHPIWETTAIEQGIQHKDEVAFRQENMKVKDALASRKNLKRTYRMYGQR